MCKASLLLSEIVFKHHPEFKPRSSVRRLALRCPNLFKVEHLIEETMAMVGGYNFTDGDHEDCDDGTEIKTASVWFFQKDPSVIYTSFPGEISNVRSPGGTNKHGALRVVIYNPWGENGEEVRYYFLPKYVWENDVTVHPTSNVGKVKFSYHQPTDSIKKFERYRCSSFKELATRNANWTPWLSDEHE